MNCIVLDSDVQRGEEFQEFVELHFGEKLQIIGNFAYSIEIIKEIHNQYPDILFVGIDENFVEESLLSALIPNPEFDIILITDKKEYLINCFRVGAFDFLLRPFQEEAIGTLVARLDSRYNKTPLNNWVFDVIRNVRSNNLIFQKVPIPLPDGYQFIDPFEIVYCEAEESYCHIHFADEKHLLISRSLIQIQKILPSNYFFRIHKSYLINLNYIVRYHKNQGFAVTMKNGKTLPVAIRRNDAFLKRVRLQ